MIVFRIIQAVAVSADYPTAMAILAVTFKPGKERAQALGLWSTAFAAAAVFGPLIGGPLIDNFGWRSIFLINLPVGLVGIAMAYYFVNESVSGVGTKNFDWWGASYLGASLGALVLVLDRGVDWGWFSMGSMLLYFCVILFMFLFLRVELEHPEPIVDLKFFKNSVFVMTLTNNFVSFMGLIGGIFLIPVFSQTFLGLTATQSGYLFIPMAVCMVGASAIGGTLTGKVAPRYVIFFSTLVASIGLYFFSWLDPRSTAIDIIIPLSVMAAGLGFGMAQRTNSIAAVVPVNEIGVASSVLALVRNIAGAFGISVFTTILSNIIKSNVLAISANSIIHATSAADYKTAIGLIILRAEISSYDKVFLIASIVLFIGSFTALFINLSKDDMNKGHPEVFVE